jgi:hypothetical protein
MSLCWVALFTSSRGEQAHIVSIPESIDALHLRRTRLHGSRLHKRRRQKLFKVFPFFDFPKNESP